MKRRASNNHFNNQPLNLRFTFENFQPKTKTSSRSLACVVRTTGYARNTYVWPDHRTTGYARNIKIRPDRRTTDYVRNIYVCPDYLLRAMPVMFTSGSIIVLRSMLVMFTFFPDYLLRAMPVMFTSGPIIVLRTMLVMFTFFPRLSTTGYARNIYVRPDHRTTGYDRA